MARVDRISPIERLPEYFSDFTTNFARSPITGDLAVVSNDEAVKQSIVNIILTMVGERPYSGLGSKINSSLFENFPILGAEDQPEQFNTYAGADTSREQIVNSIREAISNWEPRANVQDIQFVDARDSNEYRVTVVFSLINIPGVFSVNVNIQRVR